jgi:CubicO group peptidase (beta-lactamase class C family)
MKSYGFANLEWDIPNTSKTKFNIASLTKQFTGMAILKMAEQGKLKLEDPVSKYFAGSPPSWQGITIYHLLSHTSGIPNAEVGDFPKGITQRYSPIELIEMVRTKPLDFQPGSKRKYSNSGYYLLGYIVENVAGQKYAEYIDQNIFEPLGMNDSGYETNTSILKHKAQGYGVDGNTLQNADYLDWSIPYSAGALYSTTEDLLRWDRALYSEKLLSRPWLDQLFSPDKSGYNYGWFIKEEKGRTKIYHEGGNPGFAAFIARYPKEKTVVIVLANLETAPVAKIADDLAAMYFEK